MKWILTLLVFFAAVPSYATTWYVDTFGGSRFSTNQPAGLCDGTLDAAPVGTTPNQHCAFNDVRMLWQDGSYTTGSTFPGWGWIGAGGDTYIIEGTIADGVSYRVGWQDGVSYCGTTGCWGLTGDSTGSGAPPPPSGTAGQHTRILGQNYASCLSPTAKTQLHGGWAAGHVLDFSGSSYVDVACLDITDFTPCPVAGSNCTGLDFSNEGIDLANTSTHDTFTDVHVHGMAGTAFSGPTGDGVVLTRVDMIGNAGSGWNADNGSGTTGIGSLLVQNFNISWNGCAEEYPIVDPNPYANCRDQSSGGYGDGFGTTTLASPAPGWQVHFDQGTVSYNTQDGLDALHISGPGSTMTVTRVLAFGNEGQQIKVGGATATARNNQIVGNCEALIQGSSNPNVVAQYPQWAAAPPIPGTPKGFGDALEAYCRGANTAVLINLTPGDPAYFQDNVIYSGGAVGLEVEYATADTGDTNTLQYNNNIFVGFTGPGPGGQQANAMYCDGPEEVPAIRCALDALTVPGGSFSNNSYFHGRTACPNTGETNSICVDPGLVDETYHPYGYGNMTPASVASAVVGAGVAVPGITVDFNGVTRPNPPSIGPIEFAGAPAPTLVSIAVTPNPGSVLVGSTLAMTCTATFSDSSTAACTSPTWTSSTSHATVSGGVVTGASAGSASITATIGSIAGSATVNVSTSSPTLASIAITPNPGSITSIGSTLAMACTATYSDTSTGACVSPVWSSTATSKVTVNASTGIATSVSTGSSVVTATIGAISGSSTVNVSAGTTIQFIMGGKVIFSGTVVVK
jgi:hypothetical protein